MNSPNLQYFLQVNRIFFVDTNTNEGVSLPIYSHWKLLGKATAFHQCCCKTWHGPNNKSCTTRWLLTRSLLNLCPLEIFTFAPSLAFNLLTPPIFKGSYSRCWLSKRGTGKGSLDVLVKFSLVMSGLLKVTSGKPQVSNIVSKDPFPALLLLVKKENGTVERFAPKHLCSRRAVFAMREIQCWVPPCCQTPTRCTFSLLTPISIFFCCQVYLANQVYNMHQVSSGCELCL